MRVVAERPKDDAVGRSRDIAQNRREINYTAKILRRTATHSKTFGGEIYLNRYKAYISKNETLYLIVVAIPPNENGSRRATLVLVERRRAHAKSDLILRRRPFNGRR